MLIAFRVTKFLLRGSISFGQCTCKSCNLNDFKFRLEIFAFPLLALLLCSDSTLRVHWDVFRKYCYNVWAEGISAWRQHLFVHKHKVFQCQANPRRVVIQVSTNETSFNAPGQFLQNFSIRLLPLKRKLVHCLGRKCSLLLVCGFVNIFLLVVSLPLSTCYRNNHDVFD